MGDKAALPKTQKTRQMSKKVRHILFAVCCVVMAASLAYIGYYAYGYFQQKALESKQRDLVSLLPPPPSAPAIVAENPSSSPSTGISDESAPPTESGDDAQTPEPPPPAPDYRARFQNFLDANGDFYGLLTIKDLSPNLDNAFVMQGEDNSYYLYRSFDHSRNDRGTLFLDFQAQPNWRGRNYVIYGHNMFDSSMFNHITKLANVETYLESPIITFDTIYGPTTWLIFSVYTCEYDFNYYHTYFSDEEWEELLDEIYLRSNYHTGVDVLPSDKLLTLSTCKYDFQDARFVVHARLLREGENIEDFTPTATINDNRKNFNVPKQIAFEEVPGNGISFVQYTGMRRYYFYSQTARGITWYMGTSLQNVQGPYTAWGYPLDDSYFTWLASGVTSGNGLNFFIVTSGVNGSGPGLYVLRRGGIPGAGGFSLRDSEPITPKGIDARWPMVYVNADMEAKVFFTVQEDDGATTAFYSVSINGGECTLIHKVDASLDARPSSAIDTDKGVILFIQEFATGEFKALYLDGGTETVKVDIPGFSGRYMVYYDMNARKIKFIHDKDGVLETGDFDISIIPPNPPPREPDPVESEDPAVSGIDGEGLDGSEATDGGDKNGNGEGVVSPEVMDDPAGTAPTGEETGEPAGSEGTGGAEGTGSAAEGADGTGGTAAGDPADGESP